jgi:hypothetical protein
MHPVSRVDAYGRLRNLSIVEPSKFLLCLNGRDQLGKARRQIALHGDTAAVACVTVGRLFFVWVYDDK